MRKLFLLTGLLCSLAVFSQEKAIRSYDFFDNFYVGVNGGATLSSFDNYKHDYDTHGFTDFTSPQIGLYVGKWLSPQIGLRLSYDYAKQKTSVDSEKFTIESFPRHAVFGDFVFNASEILAGHKEYRKWNIEPYAGIGYIKGISNRSKVQSSHNIATRVGLIAQYSLSKSWAINADVSSIATNETLNSKVKGFKYDLYSDFSVGVVYRFRNPKDGKKTFATLTAISKEELSNIDTFIKNQSEELTIAKKEAAYGKDIIAVQDAEIAQLKSDLLKKVNSQFPNGLKNASVFETVVEFSVNSAFLEYKQQANVHLIAKQLLKNNSLNVTLVGYADKQTGTSEFNKQLSAQRANAVKRELINRWKVGADRIATTIVGSDAQEFDINNWNRAVIIVLHD